MSIKLMADSASDLPLNFFAENNVTMLPLKVHVKDQEFEDLLTINPETVYESIRNGDLPKTSQVSPAVFEKYFTELAQNNESGLYIAFSSELSGTYSTAVMIRDQVKEQYPDLDLTIIDSKCASLGCGLVVRKVAKLLKDGATKEQVTRAAEFNCKHMEHLFSVDDLDHLAKGGRVSKASAFVGGLLNIKPLLNVEDGKLVPIEKIRGKKKLMRRIIEVMKERGDSLQEQVIGISHADDKETAEEMKNMIIEEFKPQDVYISDIGAAIGSHTGPGTIAIFFLNKHQS
jgi:DegV family protein with EDD domain